MIASLRSKARPVTQCRLQENIDSHDIGFDERIRSIDRSVDMTFGRKVDHGVGPECAEGLCDRCLVGDVGFDEAMVWRRQNDVQSLFSARIGEFIHCKYVVPGRDSITDDRRPNESCAARHKNFQFSLRIGVVLSYRDMSLLQATFLAVYGTAGIN